MAFIGVQLAASAVYLVNDVRDVEADQEALGFPADRRRRGARVAGVRRGVDAGVTSLAMPAVQPRTWRW